MDKAKRARTAETPKQPSLGLKLRAPYLYPDRRGLPPARWHAIQLHRQWSVSMALGKMESGSEREFVIEVGCSPLREMAPQGTDKGAKASCSTQIFGSPRVQGLDGLRSGN